MTYVMVFDSENLQLKAVSQWMRDVPTDAKRGDIFDKYGNALVSTATLYNIYVRPNSVKDKRALAVDFADIFGGDVSFYFDKMQKSASEILIKSKVNKDQLSRILALNSSGVYYGEDNFRYYPYGDFMTQLLGFCTTDGVGQTGLEAFYNEYLTGVNGKIMSETDLVGKNIGAGNEMYLPSISGMNLMTTLDTKIQQIVEGAVDNLVSKFNPKGISCTVINYNTGEIVALSEYPSFNLNNVPRDDISALFSHSKVKAVSTVLEPGSTFKILTAAAALDSGVVDINDRFFCPGYRMVDGQRIKCWKSKGHGSISFVEGVEQSCNCVFMDSAMKLGTEEFYNFLEKCGLRSKTGIDISGETSGLFIAKNDVKVVDLARIGFGQAVAVTPIGLLSATSAIINGGHSICPHILNSAGDDDGNIIYNFDNNYNSTQIVKSDTSRTMIDLLENVVRNGSGKGAYVPGYKILGKTGTAQKYKNGAIDQGKYISSFIGFSVVDGANYGIMLSVDEPSGYIYYGSLVAAPAVGDIFRGIFSAKQIEPEYDKEEFEIIGKPFKMPNFEDMDTRQAMSEIARLGLHVEVDGSGDSVKGQYPETGTIVDKRNAVLLLT